MVTPSPVYPDSHTSGAPTWALLSSSKSWARPLSHTRSTPPEKTRASASSWVISDHTPSPESSSGCTATAFRLSNTRPVLASSESTDARAPGSLPSA